MSHRDVWRARILQWRKLYPDPRWTLGRYDPTKVRATPLRCRKCGSTERVTRHHKGHEYLFACFMPEWYAARYIRFVRVDWIPLCTDRCHPKIHELYTPVVEEVKAYFQSCLEKVRYAPSDVEQENPIFVWRHYPSRKVLESFRKRLIAKCDSWMRRRNKKLRLRKYRDYRENPT